MRQMLRLTTLLAVIISCSPALAEMILLSELIDNNGYIDSGGIRFDLFEYYQTGDMPSADDINVITFTDAFGNFGITFQGGFGDLFGDGASDALIRFQVTSIDPDHMISGAYLAGNPIAIGDAAMLVTETFLPVEPDDIMAIYHINPGDESQRLDSVIFDDPYRSFLVQQNIHAWSQTEGSIAALSMIDQSFRRVPEPSAAVVLLGGMALLVCFLRCFAG
ncbi:MAG: hypothetical protein JXM70_22085 [Pirellulales bacterium]|nr:hypothetical protein [Pirellulales bacterium]